MPRRRPKAVRAARWRPPGHVLVHRIRGVSARTRVAVRRVEAERLGDVNVVVRALWRFDEAFRQPGRHLTQSEPYSPGLEIEDARDDLDEVLRRLPPGARRDLGRLVSRIDEEFERRTLPDPAPQLDWTAGRWWWWRTREL